MCALHQIHRLRLAVAPAAFAFAVVALSSIHASASAIPPEPDALCLTDHERQLQLAERQARVIADTVAQTDPDDLEKGSLVTIAANLASGNNLEWARERLKKLNEKPSGAMFWMYPMIMVLKAGAPNLTDEDWAGIRETWKTYFPYRGDTENHWLMYYSSLFLAAETWPDVIAGLRQHLPEIKAEISPEKPLGVGLRLAAKAADALSDPTTFDELQDFLVFRD